MSEEQSVPTIEHAGLLEDWPTTPGWVLSSHESGHAANGLYSCAFCGVGDSGIVVTETEGAATRLTDLPQGEAVLRLRLDGEIVPRRVLVHSDGHLEVATTVPLCPRGGVVAGQLLSGEQTFEIAAKEIHRATSATGALAVQHFGAFRRSVSITDSAIAHTSPTPGCIKLKLSTLRQRPAYPVHVVPSVLEDGTRRPIGYQEAIERLARLVLGHRSPFGKTLVYASGQLDYFAIFAMQEVFRLLGIRNLTGNAEHCLNAGAVHNEILTGQEGPFLTIAQSIEGPGRVYLFNGWNGFITHPPVFAAIARRPDLDAFLIEVMVTESAKAVAQRLGPERVVLIKPRSDPQLALAVAHEILTRYPDAIDERFIRRFSDVQSFESFAEFAKQTRFAPDRVAQRIAPEPEYVDRLDKAVRSIAYKFTRPGSVPINIPSVGLSQTSGVVAHCLWGCVLAMIGKYGLRADGTPAGGTLRVPGQINAETEVQGLSRKYFMGRVPLEHAPEAARRMGLPDEAYAPVLEDVPRAALDYSDPTPNDRELFLCFGTQFEANMIGRPRWIDKLEAPGTTLVVIDPIPDPYSLGRAELVIPSPPHPATTKLYQNGEWKLSLSVPQKRHSKETRSDAAILYDLAAEVTRLVETNPEIAQAHPDLARHVRSGYMRERFCAPGLLRVEGEVSRPQLWERIQDYMSGGCGPLYCRPEHPDGRPITWDELVECGSLIYGGVGESRFRLNYDDPSAMPFCDIYRRPHGFRFFLPKPADIEFPEGITLNSGRSTLSDDRDRIRFATSTFNSGKATPIVNMPDENPLHVSPSLAERSGLRNGRYARVTSRDTGESILLPVVVTDRVKGSTTYVSFHKSRAQMEDGVYVNTVSSHEGRCAYSGQTSVKTTQVLLEPADPPRVDTTLLDARSELPIWTGQTTPLYVTDIIRETHDVFTFRFQGKPLCRFAYWPGQFCTLVLNIDGQKVVRSYSISSTPTRPYVLEITVKRVPGGLVSNWLPDNLRVGHRVEVSGPKGAFCLMPGKVPPKMLLIGAGSGVTPMMSMARWLCDVSADVDVRLFNCVRSPADIIYRRELEHLTARHRQFSPMVVTTTRGDYDGWTGLTGRITPGMLQMLAPDLHERQLYMCGPSGFMDATKGILRELGFDMAKLHSESFGGIRTSARKKLAPLPSHGIGGPAGSDPEPEEGGPIGIEFARSGKSSRTDGNVTLLEIAEEHDVPLDYACRAGSCGECKVRLISGEVHMDSSEGLTPAEKEAGYILTCVATPRTHCAVDC